jgi:hypothetical protein
MNSIKKEFEEKGFCLIPHALPQSLVKDLLIATEATLNNQVFSYDFCTINESQHIHKVKYMFEKDAIFLKALAHDSILSIVLSLIDDPQGIVPTWEDMLIKIPHVGIPVTVHQDLALQSLKTSVFSLGIYLHTAHHNPVSYLPGSHKLGPLTREEIYEVYTQEKNNFVPLYAHAGDISVHNVKTVHFSEENKTPHPRYTWYLEFRTIEQLLNDSPWDYEWICQRRAIWIHALKTYRKDKNHLIPDAQEMIPYMNPLNLRVSHTNEKIQYDMKNPYNHFV